MPSPISRKVFYKAVDKEGITVILEKNCWYGHILKFHGKQMSHRLYDIKATIEKPDRVDDYFVNGIRNRVYFKHWKYRDPLGQEYLKVPAQLVIEKGLIFRVLTAHPLEHLPPMRGK